MFEKRIAPAAGIETQVLARGEGGDGDDVPQVLGDDVGDQEIDLVESVGAMRAAALHPVTAFGVTLGGFHLHADESAAGVEDEIVALAVSPRLGHGEAEAGGFGEKNGLGDFTITFAGGAADGVNFLEHQRLRCVWSRVLLARILEKKAIARFVGFLTHN